LRKASFNSKKNSVGPTRQRQAYIKKITIACPTDKGDPGRLTIVTNKCSIVRNAPCRMNMNPPGAPTPTGARVRSRVQGCQSGRNHSIGLDPVCELSGFPLVPCPGCGMARVVEGRTQKEGENHGRLYFKCVRNSVSSLLCLPNLS
jgi:hypothetical protein